ncbi:MAG: NADP-dependent isocitrate dehydrogenase [Bernardetiaceae bacterium]|nr:NADP-dependent isocitrate dehydrogenase [Bernardetiaceae bacterium]
MSKKTPITVAYGDGIGPEIMKATLQILEAAGAELDIDEIEIGEKVYLKGNTAGIEPSSWDSLRRNRIFLKAPITTPQGGGFKSLNVTIRKTLGLYANVRPCISYSPYITTKHPKMDLVIIRENEEDLYAGIEHQQTDEVTQCLKLISRPGCEKIVRYAFEYARAYGRKKVTCLVKDNIMKLTDGLFHQVFNEIAAEYPDIEHDHWIVDIGAARVADTPEIFDVIVTLNLYGDIISDIAAQITGSVGLAGSANIGDGIAMFEAIHGSAPPIAGQNVANPSGLLLGAIQMLVYIGQSKVAEKVHNAWLRTIEDGVHTADIYCEATSTQQVTTSEFAEAVIKRIGQAPEKFKVVSYDSDNAIKLQEVKTRKMKKEIVGVDIFLQWSEKSGEKRPAILGDALAKCEAEGLKLKMITNRGLKVYPDGFPETFCTDHWRCRFQKIDETPVSNADIIQLMQVVDKAGFDIIKTENLCTFDGKISYSLGQGQ